MNFLDFRSKFGKAAGRDADTSSHRPGASVDGGEALQPLRSVTVRRFISWHAGRVLSGGPANIEAIAHKTPPCGLTRLCQEAKHNCLGGAKLIAVAVAATMLGACEASMYYFGEGEADEMPVSLMCWSVYTLMTSLGIAMIWCITKSIMGASRSRLNLSEEGENQRSVAMGLDLCYTGLLIVG